MSILVADKLRKSFNGRTVVQDVSLTVNEAETVGLLGRNGAGKTTSFRMTIGMIEPDAGKVFFAGEEVTGLPMYRHARRGMGYLSQEPSAFQRMTCEQNLLAILETVPGMSRKARRKRAAELLDQFGLTKKTRELARTCSGGERRKLEIARALQLARDRGAVYVHCHHGKHRSAGAAGAAAVTLGWSTTAQATERLKVSGT